MSDAHEIRLELGFAHDYFMRDGEFTRAKDMKSALEALDRLTEAHEKAVDALEAVCADLETHFTVFSASKAQAKEALRNLKAR